VAPRNFQQPFNRPQFPANEQNASRSLMGVTETRRWRHNRPTFPMKFAAIPRERFPATSVSGSRGGGRPQSICYAGQRKDQPLDRLQHGHWRCRSGKATTKVTLALANKVARRVWVMRHHHTAFDGSHCSVRPTAVPRRGVWTGLVDQAISASCTRSPYRKGKTPVAWPRRACALAFLAMELSWQLELHKVSIAEGIRFPQLDAADDFYDVRIGATLRCGGCTPKPSLSMAEACEDTGQQDYVSLATIFSPLELDHVRLETRSGPIERMIQRQIQ
jgi:hypothetical protein